MTEAPIGFLMALSQNEHALKRYGSMDQKQRARIIDRARNVDSRDEMQRLVDSIQ